MEPTKRADRDVPALVGAGLSNARIANRLNLVEGTVKGHVSAILGRLDLGNRVRAAVLAHDAGLVTDCRPPPHPNSVASRSSTSAATSTHLGPPGPGLVATTRGRPGVE